MLHKGDCIMPTPVATDEVGEQSTLGESNHEGSWRRATLETPFHIFTIALCFFFVAVIEVLLQLSKRNGALLFPDPKTDELPTYAVFCFEYLPIIIAVMHNVLWMTVDHDIKRIEPFFQLSKPGGAEAKDSLLLHYPYQFAPFVPLTAFRKRNWTVFCSSTVALLTAYAATPLMSAILTKETIERSIDFDVMSNAILPVSQQAQSVSALFSYLVYGYKLLGDPMPAFSTENFGVLPFAPAIDLPISRGEWVVNTTLYEADLDCVEAVEKRTGGRGSQLTLSNGRDCEFTFLDYDNLDQDDLLDIRNERFFTEFPYMAVLMNYDTMNQAIRERSLGPTPFTLTSKQANCSNPHQIFALWNRSDGMTVDGLDCGAEADGSSCTHEGADRGTTPENFAAVFCEPKYFEQSVQVTVDAVTGRVNEALRLGSKRPFDAGVDSAFFESFATYGKLAASTPALNVARDYAPNDRNVFGAPDVRDRMAKFPQFQMAGTFDSSKYGRNTGIEASINTGLLYSRSMMGIAIIDQQSLDDLLDPRILARKLQEMYRLYFSYAVTSELSAPNKTMLTAQWKFKTQAYTTDPLWAGLLQATFSAMAVLDIILTCLLYKRRLNLNSDPGSLAALLSSITSSQALLSDFRGSEFLLFKKTATKLESDGSRYHLLATKEGGHRIDKNASVDGVETKLQPVIPALYDESVAIKSARPWELSLITGVSIIGCLLSLVGLFIALFESGQRYNGLPRLSDKVFLRNMVFSYAPTIVSTLIENFLLAITRFVCLIMPYHEMQMGPTRSNLSLAIHYENRPPHFLLINTLKKGHYLLSSLIAAAILANILAVSLGGMFSPTTREFVQSSVAYSEIYHPQINPNRITTLPKMDTIFYAAMRNASDEDPKVPWTMADYYFLPFQPNNASSESSRITLSRTAETWAFKAKISCTAPENSQLNFTDHEMDSANDVYLSPIKDTFLRPGGNCSAAQLAKHSHESIAAESIRLSPDPLLGYVITNIVDADAGEVLGNYTRRVIAAGEVYHEKAVPFRHCAGTFGAAWVRYGVKEAVSPDLDVTAFGTLAPEEAVYLICQAGLTVARHSVTVNDQGFVLSHNQTDQDVAELDRFIDESAVPYNHSTVDYLGMAFQQFILPTEPASPRLDPRPHNWISFLIQQRSPGLSLVANVTATADVFEKVYARLFPIFLNTYSDSLFTAADDASLTTSGSAAVKEDRMMISTAMMILGVTILAVFVLVIAVTYLVRPGASMIHIPTTIAATIALVYASNVGEDTASTHSGDKEGSLTEHPKLRDAQMYGYGWFVGRDGEHHLGVDREPVYRTGARTLKRRWL
ncbi:hypothetical protein BZA05DRAFT_468136 [Tricharina praecox]|uniref:uncharacterized protein n=1 Tax=Tricharina praecox TaxID=43433 RepID=UPI00221FF56A|nr:uncharacterized protein BZA05DRAFT_468136 [Tricharina praecox]KAI5854475.1 hypothetical protein BZA05DRAFT_468136 [Tricharina praecox]